MSGGSPGRDHPARLDEVVRVFLAHPSPRLLVGIVAASLLVRLALGDVSTWDGVVAIAIVALWPIQEWLIHVFFLHYRPRRVLGRTLDFTVPRMHRAHHREPWRLDLVFIPTQVFAWAPFAGGALAWLLLPSPPLAATAILVYFALALHYEWVHLLVHTRYKPRSALYARLWRNHRLHHFKNEHYWYGVTMLSGDHLLRTHPRPDETPSSPTARSLGLEESLGEAT